MAMSHEMCDRPISYANKPASTSCVPVVGNLEDFHDGISNSFSLDLCLLYLHWVSTSLPQGLLRSVFGGKMDEQLCTLVEFRMSNFSDNELNLGSICYNAWPKMVQLTRWPGLMRIFSFDLMG